jgi:mRNA interferase RelE/StbE
LSKYNILFAKSARQDLEKLDPPLVQQIFPKIEALTSDPRPKGCLKLKGKKNIWRIRVGDYRVLYSIYDDSLEVDIIAVLHRKESYR